MRPGETVVMPVAGVPVPHLWILITDPAPDTHLGVFVSVTSLRDGQDQTVVLRRGDHPYVAKDSVVYYGDARLLDTALIEKDLGAGLVQHHARCSTELLRLLQDGALASPHTPNAILRLCRQAFGR